MRFVGLLTVFGMAACGGGQSLALESTGAVRPGEASEALALDEIVRDGKLIFVDAEGATLRSVDVASGREMWRSPIGNGARSALLLDLGAGRVLVQISQRFVTLRLSDGSVLAEREAPAAWRFVKRNNGACALSEQCGLQPISCDDGRPLGEPLRGETVSYSEEDGVGTCSSNLDILGKAGELSLYQLDSTVIARNASGATTWERSDAACENCVTFFGNGMASDGSLCWTSAHEESAITTRVFSCATGAASFVHRTLRPSSAQDDRGFMTAWVSDPPGIFVASMNSATLVAPDGSERWTAAVAEGALAMPEDAHVAAHPIGLNGARSLVTLDPRTGGVLRTAAVDSGELRIVEGHLEVHSGRATSDRGGAAVPAPLYFEFDRDRHGSRVLHRSEVLLALPGDGHVVGEVLTDAEAILVVAEVRHQMPDVVHVLRVPR